MTIKEKAEQVLKSMHVDKATVIAMPEEEFKAASDRWMKSQKNEQALIVVFTAITIMNGWRANA